MAKRGRRPKGEYPEKKRVFASRIRQDTWEILQQAAARSGRSISQEFEHRLRRGLDDDKSIELTFGDPRTFALMKIAAMAAVNSAPPTQKGVERHWTSDVEAFDRALDAILHVLRAFRPHELTAADLVPKAAQLDTPILQLIQDIQAADPARSLGKMSKRQRTLIRLKNELGELVDRPSRVQKAKHQKAERKTK